MIGEIIAGGVALGQALATGGPKRQYKWNKRAAEDSNRMNRENAQWQLDQQLKIQQEQRMYDSPENQMARLKSAGLNPNLIYGSGASSSGGTFAVNAPGIAPSRVDAPRAQYPDVAGSFVGASQALAQTELIGAKTGESEARTELARMQRKIAATNPMLDPGVYGNTIDMLRQIAQEKERNSAFLNEYQKTGDHYDALTRGQRKIEADIEALMQRLKLNTSDLAIRNKILESKEYDNAIKEIQAEWLKDGSVTPEHIRQGLMLLLSKMIGR